MTTRPDPEVHEISERMNRFSGWAKLILIAVIGLIGTIVTYGITTESRITVLEASRIEQAKQIAANEIRIQENTTQLAIRSRELSSMSSDLKAYGRSIERLQETISELMRYLREHENTKMR